MSSLLVSEVARIQTSKYVKLSGFAVLLFDYCITFQDEVQWTWSRPWNLIRVIFIISRYLPLVSTGITAYSVLLVSGPNPPNGNIQNVIHVIGIVAAEGLLLLRVWAFWQKSRRLLIGLLSYGLLTIIAAVAVNMNRNPLIPGRGAIPGLFETSRDGAVVYTFLATYESVLLILIAYKRFRDYGDFQGSIIKTVYRDGMFYILCIIAITVTNVIVDAAFSLAYNKMFDTLQLVIHSVLASRILFRLRMINDQAYEMPTILLVESNIHYLQPSNVGTTGTGSEV